MTSDQTQSASAEPKTGSETPLSSSIYLLVIVVTMLAALSSIAVINFYFDPLWYAKGNTLTGMNYVFDERTSKPTRLAQLETKPDCLLLGTSSGSLMNAADRIANARCFNLAVSKGHADEFEAFATWAASQDIKAKTVIFEVDAVSLMRSAPSTTLPSFVLDKEAPPSPFVSYISLRVLNFSVKTLLKVPINPRYYDRNFEGAVQKAPPYDPNLPHSYNDSLGPFQADDFIRAIGTVRSTWPGVKVICYSAPFTPDFTAAIDRNGTLDSFVRSLLAISKKCDAFRDFNIPSDLTNDRNRTYDGIHYTPETNARFAEVFLGSGEFPESDVSALSPQQYVQRYRDALARLELKSAGQAKAE